MNDELMEFPSLLSLSSSPNGSLCIGEIPVTVPIIGDPDLAPSGISLPDPGPAMVETRSNDMRRLEEILTAAMTAFSARAEVSDRKREESDKLRDLSGGARDLAMKEIHEEILALRLQQNEILNRIASTPTAGQAGQFAADRRSDHTLKERLHGSGTCAVAPNLLQSTASTLPENLQKRDKSVDESTAHFSAEVSNFIRRQTPELQQANSGHYFSNPLVELRSLKQLGMVSDYLNHFKTLLEKVEINESYAVHLFVSGLNYHIHNSVWMFRPKSLVHAFALARLQESSLNFRGIYYANLEVKDEVCTEGIENEMVMKLKGKEFSSDGIYENVEVMEKVWVEQTETGMVMNLKEKRSSLEGGFELMNSTSFAAQETEKKFNKNSSSTHGGGSGSDMEDVDVNDAVRNMSNDVLQGKVLDVGHNLICYPRAESLAVAEVKGSNLFSRVPAPDLEFGGWNKYLNFRDGFLSDTQGSPRDMNAMVPDVIHTTPKVLHKWIEEPRHRTARILQVSREHFYETERFQVGCSKLGQRKLFFELLETIIKLGNRRNGEIESAPHKIEEPKHRTERVFRVFKDMFQGFAAENIQIFNLEDKVYVKGGRFDT